jgi:hypothetical protein
MRALLLVSLAFGFLLAGCASEYNRNTGISCATAVSIAEDHSARHFGGQSQSRTTFRNVEQANWEPSEKVWLVDLSSADGYYSREYKINREGFIVGYQIVDRKAGGTYVPDEFDSGYIGAEWPTTDAPSPVGEAPQ